MPICVLKPPYTWREIQINLKIIARMAFAEGAFGVKLRNRESRFIAVFLLTSRGCFYISCNEYLVITKVI